MANDSSASSSAKGASFSAPKALRACAMISASLSAFTFTSLVVFDSGFVVLRTCPSVVLQNRTRWIEVAKSEVCVVSCEHGLRKVSDRVDTDSVVILVHTRGIAKIRDYPVGSVADGFAVYCLSSHVYLPVCLPVFSVAGLSSSTLHLAYF